MSLPEATFPSHPIPSLPPFRPTIHLTIRYELRESPPQIPTPTPVSSLRFERPASHVASSQVPAQALPNSQTSEFLPFFFSFRPFPSRSYALKPPFPAHGCERPPALTYLDQLVEPRRTGGWSPSPFSGRESRRESGIESVC